MGARSKVFDLPEAQRQELDSRLINSGFKGYVELEEWLRQAGFEIGKSSLHRYGSKLEDRIATLKASTDQARALVEASPDDEASMSRGLMRLYQQKLWDAMYEMELDPDSVDINKVGKLLGPLVRAEVHLTRFASEVRAKTSKVVDELAAAQGMTADQAQLWREKFLGVVKA